MILNVAIAGGTEFDRARFSRRFISCIEYEKSVFDLYRRKVPFDVSFEAHTAFSVNQLLCDAMVTNEALGGLVHIYKPLRLVVHRDTPFDVADLTGDDPVSSILRDEIEAVYKKYRLDFLFKIGESPTPPSAEAIFDFGPEKAAAIINKVCDANGLIDNSWDTA